MSEGQGHRSKFTATTRTRFRVLRAAAIGATSSEGFSSALVCVRKKKTALKSLLSKDLSYSSFISLELLFGARQFGDVFCRRSCCTSVLVSAWMDDPAVVDSTKPSRLIWPSFCPPPSRVVWTPTKTFDTA